MRNQIEFATPILRFTFIILVPWAIFAQPQAASRPKIGVAFEGGGALGLAHIGVLQWLEEHKIPVDYIAGTSMGGVVGGLYSTGMRPAEIHELMSKIDWRQTLSGQVPFNSLSYRRKEDRRTFQNNLEFGLRRGFSLPSGLTSDKDITFFLDRETLPYSEVKSFDDLPIPFRSVATDLITGRAFVLKDGPLGDALRATMSLPFLFPPVQRGGSLYADGGFLNNLPVDVVKQMGAEIVIAVYLRTSPFQPQNNQSMLTILNRSINVMIAANELHSLETADLVISVDLQGYTSSDFTAGEQIIPRGYDGAAQKSFLLARLGVDEPGWQDYLAARESRRIRSVATPEFVQVAGVDRPKALDIEKTLANNVGKPVDTNRLERDINLVSGLGRFYGFSYGMTEKGGRQGLLLRGNEKEYAPPLLNFGLLLDGSDIDNVRFTMSARITALDVGGFRSEWRTDLSAGSTWGVSTEYYKPLSSTSNWFVAARASGISGPFDLYDHATHLAEYARRQIGGGLDFGYAVDRSSEIRFGYDASYLEASLSVGDPSVLPTPFGRVGTTSIRYNLDRLDSPVIPRSGQILSWQAQWNDASPGANGGFPLSEMYFGVIHPIDQRGSIFVQGFGGSTFGFHDTGIPQFFLGGHGRLSAYGTNELRTNQYWLARAGYEHELFRLPLVLGNKVYATGAYEFANPYGAPGASRIPTDASIGIVMDTFLGPLSVGGSYGDSGHHKVYFLLGRFF
jgi:NTE family protein